jgi:hypothetical protein
MNCRDCKKYVEQTPGKRAKEFCNSTCRSNFWQKEDRKKKVSNPKAQIKYLNENTSTVSNKTKPAPKIKIPIDTAKKENRSLNQAERPQRLPNEGVIDYAGRINEWKKLQK